MWTIVNENRYGVCIYNYNGNTTYGLPLEIGETVELLEECQGWYRGCSTRNRSVKGLFPVSFIHLKPCQVKNDGHQEIVVPVEDPTVAEVTWVLREWFTIYKKLYVQRENGGLLSRVQSAMRDLLDWRRQLVAGTLTQDQTRQVRAMVTARIDWGNRQLGLDLIPRVDCEVVDPLQVSPILLYKVHHESSEAALGPTEVAGGGTLKKKESSSGHSSSHHLFLSLRDFNFSLGEDIDLYFSLYDANQSHFISDKFLVRMAKSGQSHFVEKFHSQCTVFTDLGTKDLSKDLYVVIHLIRTGRMLNDSKKMSNHWYRRPHGCAVLALSELVSQAPENSSFEEEQEFSVKVYMNNEAEFYMLHDFLIKKQTNKYMVLPGQTTYGLMVSLRLLHGSLSQLKQESPLLFKQLTALTPKMGFSDVIMPGDVRNDLYFTLERGEFEKGGKSTNKNIEATITLVSPDGHLLENCICPGAGQENVSTFSSLVLYHNNSPRWADTFRLAIPIERFDGAYLRIDFYHCSTRDKDKKLLGFSFCQLMDDNGTILENGQHELYVYKCEERAKIQDWQGLPWGPKSGPGSGAGTYSRSPREVVLISTLLCSTKLTQNGHLLGLLKWRSQPENCIGDTLAKLLSLDGEEIVKFLQDILDALFALFSTGDGNSTPHSGQVFKVLVYILNLLEDSRFEHFRPVMDTYIQKHFAAALAYKGLLSCVEHCAASALQDLEPAVIKCFKAFEYIFKFIIQSRILYARASGDQNEDSFKADLNSLFAALNSLLSSSEAAVLPVQIALVGHFRSMYDQLLRVLPPPEVAQVVKLTLNSLPVPAAPSLARAKMFAVLATVQSSIFTEHPDTRAELLEVFLRTVREQLFSPPKESGVAEVLGEILSFLFCEHHSNGESSIEQELEVLALGILEPLVLVLARGSHRLDGNLVASLIALLQLLSSRHYSLLRPFSHRYRDLLHTLLSLCRTLVAASPFPSDWTVLSMVSSNIILNALHKLSVPLSEDFLQGDDFDLPLWDEFFTLAFAFLTQPSLQLESLSEVRRTKALHMYGDMRVKMGFLILSMWEKLGEHKIHFIPGMTGHFLEVTLVPEAELRRATLPIFFDMMDCEQRARGNFKQVESELIDKLDILISENKGDDEYYHLFNTILLEKVKSNDPVWRENGITFINSITRLLERLLDYRKVMEGEENRDKRMSCTYNLLNFYKTDVKRVEMYVRYVYKLCELHVPSENFVEAAFTLKLHADLLGWSDNVTSSNGQPEWKCKEDLYLRIISYFDKGKCWEEGIPLCKELAQLYEKKLFDYAKLSNILKTHAKFLDNILTQIRPEPEYFRVGFYGQGMPLFLRNKQFIYRGLEYERIETFTQRLQNEFPHANILTKNTPPDESVLNSPAQYIQICNAKPIPELDRPEFEGHELPEQVMSYYLVNDVERFMCDRPMHKGPVDPNNEFKSLWIERTIVTTSNRLPGVLRWSEVVSRTVEEISPIRHACETVGQMNKQLHQLISTYTKNPRSSISPLSMRLQGVIEAAVNGGIAKYQEAFFTPSYIAENPGNAELVALLKTLILQKVDILEAGLALHSRLVSTEIMPLHRRLVERFSLMKQSLRDQVSENSPSRTIPAEYRRPSIVNTPLPPIPSTMVNEKRPLLDCGSSNRSSSSGSSLYGHFFPSEDDEDIYSRPQDTPPPPPPPPPLPSRPRSVALTPNGKCPHQHHHRGGSGGSILIHRGGDGWEDGLGYAAPRTAAASPRPSSETPTSSARNSWSSESHEEAPPLPPRTPATDKKISLVQEEQRPALPKRSLKKHKSLIEGPGTPPPLPTKGKSLGASSPGALPTVP